MCKQSAGCRPGWPWLGVVLLGAVLGGPVRAADTWVPTSADDYGPFYPPDWRGEIDADLTRWQGRRAEGQALALQGVVRDATGRALAGAVVEIWQTDARGRYRHPGVPEAVRDSGFQGYGRTRTGADGRYSFVTVFPGRYGSRPPHIHLRVEPSAGVEWVTQVYFRGQNQEGGLGGIVPPGREALTVALTPSSAAGPAVARFDIVLPPP